MQNVLRIETYVPAAMDMVTAVTAIGSLSLPLAAESLREINDLRCCTRGEYSAGEDSLLPRRGGHRRPKQNISSGFGHSSLSGGYAHNLRPSLRPLIDRNGLNNRGASLKRPRSVSWPAYLTGENEHDS